MAKGSAPRLVANPGEIGQVPEAPFFVPPDAGRLFSGRALRFEKTAPGNPFAAFLRFMGALAKAQHAALLALPSFPAAGPSALAAEGFLDRSALFEKGEWEEALALLAQRLEKAAMPAEAAKALRALLARGEKERARFAARLLEGAVPGEEGAEAFFLTAAFEVAAVREAGGFGPRRRGPSEGASCPLCGAPPFASFIHGQGERAGLRYLVCSFCGSEWRHVRIVCTLCGGSKGIAYHAIAGGEGPAKAESCPLCNAYTKIIDAGKEKAAEAMADDLGSLALDILMTDSGWRRGHPNPYLKSGLL